MKLLIFSKEQADKIQEINNELNATPMERPEEKDFYKSKMTYSEELKAESEYDKAMDKYITQIQERVKELEGPLTKISTIAKARDYVGFKYLGWAEWQSIDKLLNQTK